MRIRKRSQPVAVPAATTQPISCKYQTASTSPERNSLLRGRFGGSKAAECSNMQAHRRLEDVEDHERARFDVNAEPPVMEALRLSEAHVKDDREVPDLSGPRIEDTVPDKVRRRQSSPKRRKIEHESSLLFEGSASMTAAELLVVNELANGVRQRLHAASEHSTTTEVTKTLPSKPVENAKDALISSIFFVFGTCGENGLSASEVVKYMLDQRLPGLKEGGARHTVQVANVLRSSSSFISLGDKKYLLCSSLDVSRSEPSKKPTATSSRQQQQQKQQPPPHKPSPASSSPGSPSSDVDSSENEDLSPQQKPRIRAPPRIENNPHNSSTRSGNKKGTQPDAKPDVESRPASSGGEPKLLVVVKTTRRRGPSSSQKGKGPTQCKRYDGRGWQCSRLTEPGYSLCVHHQDLINKRAAKLKEQQTLSRLMESQHRKLAKSQQQQPPAAPVETVTDSRVTENEIHAAVKLQSSRDREHNIRDREHNISSPGAPVQKRKMLSLLAIK